MQQKQQRFNWAVPFFSLWTGQALSLLGSRIGGFALVWWMTETTGSAVVLSIGTILAFLPQIVLGPIIGVLIDRWNRRRVMIVSDTIVAIGSVGLALLFWLDQVQLWHVYLMTFIGATGGTVQAFTMIASTTLMVPEKHLTRVQGANQTLQGVMNIAAPPLGALLMGFLPIHLILELDVLTALFAIVPLFFIRVPQPEPTVQTKEAEATTFWDDVQAGIRYIWRWPGLLGLLVLGMIMNFLITPSLVLLPILVTDHFGGGVVQLGWLEAAFGFGILGGGILIGVWGGFQRKVVTIAVGAIGFGFSTVIIGLAPVYAFWLAWGALFVSGAMNALINAPFMALLQTRIAPDMQGRVFTIFNSGIQVLMPVGLIAAGFLSDWMDVRIWFVGGGIIATIVMSTALFIPAIMKIEDQNVDTDKPTIAIGAKPLATS
ncbi:MAG: MFS transporter [Chloroflexota bacterium]